MPDNSDKNFGPNRPLSPHLQIYKPQITSVLSIMHRFTGMGLLAGIALFIWMFSAAASGAEDYDIFLGFLNSGIMKVIIPLIAFACFYHLLNGIRHLVWDFGFGFELENVTKSGWFVVIASVVGTILFLIME